MKMGACGNIGRGASRALRGPEMGAFDWGSINWSDLAGQTINVVGGLIPPPTTTTPTQPVYYPPPPPPPPPPAANNTQKYLLWGLAGVGVLGFAYVMATRPPRRRN